VEDRGGVPVYWTELPGSVRGALIFRVGRADETLARLGLTHLVEHLAMFPIGRPEFFCNALVDETRTVFFAEGRLDEVSGFLNDVARALGELPLDRLEVERRVLQTEAEGASGGDFFARLMGYRFGAAEYGLAHYRELGLGWLGPEDVTRWARERFSTGNAARGDQPGRDRRRAGDRPLRGLRRGDRARAGRVRRARARRVVHQPRRDRARERCRAGASPARERPGRAVRTRHYTF
jgi:hypothetical protein